MHLELTVRVFHILTKFSKGHRTIVIFPIDYQDHFAGFQLTQAFLWSCTILQSEDCLYIYLVCAELDYDSSTSACANSIMWSVRKILEKELEPLELGRFRGSRYSSEAVIQPQPDPATLMASV